jgi:hypothetical protein
MHLDAASRSVDAALRFARSKELAAMNVTVFGCARLQEFEAEGPAA